MLETVFRSMVDAVIMLDTMGNIVRVNPAAVALYGFADEQDFPKTLAELSEVFEIRFADGREICPAQWPLARSLQGEVVRNVELMVRRKGTEQWSTREHGSAPVRDEQGAITHVVITVHDITEQKKAEEALRTANAELERIGRIVRLAHLTAKSGAWEGNLETNELIWTKEYFQLVQLEPSVRPTVELFYSLIHPDDREYIRRNLEDAIANASEFVTDFRAVLKDGVHWLERRGQVITDASGRACQVVGITTDVTDRKHLETALARSNQELERFAYAVSHDLKAPLRNIAAFVKLLSRKVGDLDGESQEWMRFVVENTERMQRMIEALLKYARVTHAVKPQALVDCNVVFNLALEALRTEIYNSGAVVSAERLPTVRADQERLVLLFQNLIGNAVKYRGKRRPEIHVAARQSAGEWIFSFADNGIGIDMRYRERIFDVFRRLHGSDQYEGAGIGLALCKRIAEAHGGRMWVESTPGVGSTFLFSVPVDTRD